MSEQIDMHNGINERCDMLVGTCACGAWHKFKDWEGKIYDSSIKINKGEWVIDSITGSVWITQHTLRKDALENCYKIIMSLTK